MDKTRTNLVHKNISQGCNLVGNSKSQKNKTPLHNIKVALRS